MKKKEKIVKFIVVLYIAFALLSLLPSPSTQLNQFTYEDLQAGLDLLDEDKSNDGTIILRFGKPLIRINGSTTCWDMTIYLRIIHPNASVSFFSISNHNVPNFNFCLKNGTTRDYTTIWGFDQGLVLIYYNSSNVSTSAIMGLFMTFEGTVISGILKYWVAVSISSPRDGFLFYCCGALVISWIHFSAPNSNGEIIEIASEIIQTKIKVVSVTAFYVLERGFAIAYGGNDSPSSLNSTTNIISTTNVMYIKFYYLTTNTRRGPFLIYQIPTQTLKSNNSQNFIQTTTLRGLICSVDFDGAGNICMLIMIYQSNITNTISQQTLLKVSFLSSGSVTSIGQMTNVNFTYGFNLVPLRFGGYLMLVYQGDINFGYVLDEDGNVYSNWSLPQPLVLPRYQSAYVALANNSFVIVENQNNSIWNITHDDLYRFYRQGNASSQLCYLDSNDNKTVIIQVILSTFNEPNSHYYVTIENNFVKRSDSDEALLGIDKNLWTLTTGRITGVIRLTPDGSNYYLSLSSVDQQKFHKQLATGLSSIIPIEDNRLTATDGLEKDMSTGSLQILLPFDIKDTTNLSKKILIDETYPMTIAPSLETKNMRHCFSNNSLAHIARNFAMFKLIFIAIDLGLRISFFVNDAHKVPELYIPILIILIISIFINTSASFAITVHEISKNPNFSKWASEYSQFIPILTIISAGHIEALNVLTSKFGMLEIFSTTFSEVAEKIIFFVRILCLFVCEIPQFIIQV
ncbi:hypothetical protein F8M41_008337 [Gigaspora margarita]|uniref:Uncharacterized protein n=1 Tax=Gigaspora margarita TaxID=4874 RepID=A0A8H3X3P9_GIGMA|nr:hypothetical protein F8M41_008337 [Gigaspora margarita]